MILSSDDAWIVIRCDHFTEIGVVIKVRRGSVEQSKNPVLSSYRSTIFYSAKKSHSVTRMPSTEKQLVTWKCVDAINK